MARRRRDFSHSPRYSCNPSYVYAFSFLVISFVKPVCPEISILHRMLVPLFDVVSFDKAKRWSPANHHHPLLNPCGSKTTHDEAFVSTCAYCFRSEICLSLSHGSAGSKLSSGSLRRTIEETSATTFLSAPESSYSVPMLGSLPPVTTDSTPIIAASPYSHQAATSIRPETGNLGFHLLGLSLKAGPLSFQRPSPKKGDPNCYIQKPRSVLTSPLSIPSDVRYRFLSFVRRLQTEENVPLLLWLYKISLRTLPLDSPRIFEHDRLSYTKKGFMSPFPNYLRTLPLESSRITSHVFRRMKKNGIMIPFSRRGGYRSFFRPFYPYSLIGETSHMQICYFRKEPHTPKSLKPRSDLVFMLQTGYKLCVELLNLHGRRGLHARENPPVMLRSCTYPFRTLVIASPRNLSLSNVSSPSCFHAEYKHHALITTSTCYDVSKLNSHSSTTLAINLNRRSNITFAQPLVKALPRVVLLVPARSTSLAPSQTPFRLLTLANQSFFDSLLEDLLIILDLTCIKKFHSSWFKALKEPLSTNRFYHFISFMLALGSALSCCILNLGISYSSYLCTWLLGFYSDERKQALSKKTKNI